MFINTTMHVDLAMQGWVESSAVHVFPSLSDLAIYMIEYDRHCYMIGCLFDLKL